MWLTKNNCEKNFYKTDPQKNTFYLFQNHYKNYPNSKTKLYIIITIFFRNQIKLNIDILIFQPYPLW